MRFWYGSAYLPTQSVEDMMGWPDIKGLLACILDDQITREQQTHE